VFADTTGQNREEILLWPVYSRHFVLKIREDIIGLENLIIQVEKFLGRTIQGEIVLKFAY
jgi:hypothetical protein